MDEFQIDGKKNNVNRVREWEGVFKNEKFVWNEINWIIDI